MKYCTVCKAKYEDSVSFCPVDGEVLEDDPSSIVDTVLDGQYQIESILGKGGMGAVYRARHILLGDRVAIKILPPEVRNNAEWLRRFRREGQAARRFRHPNSVTVYDLRTASDGTIYMVMEYVEGHTLDAEIKRRGSFTPAEAFEVLEPIMSVLNTAHSMGVVHRDLKPENIMIGKAGNAGEHVVKLLDLGIAKMREIAGADNGGTTALTMAGQVLGTPYYMSPEQWGEIPRDGSSEIDGRADIYSLGLVFYEMIAGRRPCAGATLSELRREHVSVTPKPLHEVVPNVTPSFSVAIARATAKDRDDRQSTAGELAAELRAAIGGGATAGFVRTLPDLPYVESSSAHTAGIPGARETKSDGDAPTIITIDSAPTTSPGSSTPTSVPRVEHRAAKPQPPFTPAAPVQQPRSPDASDQTVYEPAIDMASSVTIQTPRSVPQEAVAAPAKKSSSMLFVGLGTLIVVLIVVGGGGFLLYKWFNPTPSPTPANNSQRGPDGPTAGGAPVMQDMGRYWLELDQVSGGAPLRVAGVVPLASGQQFKFHFQMSQEGYLYIVGPGEQNQPTAFLTERPAPVSGVDSNRVTSGTDYSFPKGEGNWMNLDKKPGAENFTIIFSSSPLASPGFFKEEATGSPLSQSEQAGLNAFLAQYEAIKPSTELNDKNAAEPFIQVRVPKSDAAGNPIVFQIRIQHR